MDRNVQSGVATTERVVQALFDAIESRDLRRIAAMLSVDCTWQNVPHEPTNGRDAVVAMFASIVCPSDRVRWSIISAAHGDGVAWIERTDSFLIDDDEHNVRCNGVFLVDTNTELVTGVRDYVDLAEWRDRIDEILRRGVERSAVDVVQRHLAAVARQDPLGMAADYAIDAVLIRGEDRRTGWASIADYFDTIPIRMSGRALVLDNVITTEPGCVEVSWTMSSNSQSAELIASGTDDYVVTAGRTVRQTVTLATPDF